ncbi:CUB and sushi domain-containing protein 3-like isoform X4 [Engraulis encrasicolus]|uniref:CUB and sushi domain-containing protein 3-like isoform X4 n=1 Tax=Engraulis encrasicolus TaxID=184585 RepID=UPI002FD059E1
MSDSRSWILQLLVTIASFFIRSEAAECIAPKELGNSVILSNEHVLQNDFPDGSEAKLDCDNGFRPLNGSDTITCQNGIWSTVELTCTRKDCGPPKASPHVRFLYPKGENATLFTDRITAVCETGFRLVGSSTWQCLNYGWKGRSSCYVIECGETRNETLPVLENGETINAPHDKQRVEFGDVIQYRCHHGYHLIGNDTIKCTENGYTALPRCKKLDFYIHPSQTPKVDQRKSSGSDWVFSRRYSNTGWRTRHCQYCGCWNGRCGCWNGLCGFWNKRCRCWSCRCYIAFNSSNRRCTYGYIYRPHRYIRLHMA